MTFPFLADVFSPPHSVYIMIYYMFVLKLRQGITENGQGTNSGSRRRVGEFKR
jgi:hypothetical protein